MHIKLSSGELLVMPTRISIIRLSPLHLGRSMSKSIRFGSRYLCQIDYIKLLIANIDCGYSLEPPL